MTKPNKNSKDLEAQLAIIEAREDEEIHQLDNPEDYLF